MEKLDIRNIFGASMLPIIISVLLVIGFVVLEVLSFVVDQSLIGTVSLLTSIYLYAMFPVHFVVFLWAGARSVRKYRLDAIGAGMVASFTYFVAATFNLLVTSLIGLLVIKEYVDIPGFRSTESTLAASLIGDVAGTSGVGISFLCGAGMIIMGMLANFVIGSFGGLVTTPRSSR